MADAVLLVSALLALGFLSTRLATLAKLPHSVFLVVLGVAAGLLIRARMPESAETLSELFPEVILFVLLPPLVFESAYNLPLRDLRKDAAPIGALAVVGLLLSTALVGAGLHLAFRIDWIPALVFGALISATDPVAVVALFREIGAPKRLNTLIEGESLLNDGTAIVLFRVLLAASAAPLAGPALLASGLGQFVTVAAGGILVGGLVAILTSLALRQTASSSASQLGLTVAAGYLSFLAADHFLHVSGVIATMTVGLYLGTRARLELSKDALHGMHHVWEFLALAANTVVFFAVGVTIDPAVVIRSMAYVPGAVALIYAARFLSVLMTLAPLNASGLAKPVSFAYQVVLSWGGLRGGLALGLVLLLPVDFPHRQLFLALAGAVVLATLFLNALTIRPLLKWLGLDRLDPVDAAFLDRTLAVLRETVLEPIAAASRSGALSRALVERSLGQPREAAMSASDPAFAMKSLLLGERRYYDETLEDGILSKGAYRRLLRSVDERLAAFEDGGMEGLRRFEFDLDRDGPARPFGRSMLRALAEKLEGLLHLDFALASASQEAADPDTHGLEAAWAEKAHRELSEFYRNYPDHGTAVQALFIANTISASAFEKLQSLRDSSVISEAVLSRARQAVADRHREAIREAAALRDPGVEQLLARVPVFADVPAEVLGKIAGHCRRRSLAPGEAAVREGEPGDSLFVVCAGILEVAGSRIPAGRARPRLFTGDFFGELSLLFGQPRNASVAAVAPSMLVEIGSRDFDALLAGFPDVRRRVEETARARREAPPDRLGAVAT